MNHFINRNHVRPPNPETRNIRKPKRTGAALVEAAVVLPVFFLAIAGIVEFGRAMMVSQLVTNASREAARRGVLDGATNAEIEAYIQDKLSGALNADVSSISIAITITPDPANTTTGNNLADAQMYDLVTVDVSIPYNKVGFIAGRWLEGKQLSAQTTMRHE
ncbi:MAG: pilus assembly protein [Planctomycetaceae bacterium]|nr:pilus assembly protein [Planctomycetaceae bacterium]